MGSASMRGPARLVVLLLLGMAAGFGASHSLRWGHWVLLGVCTAVGVAIFGVSLRLEGVELGGPELSREQHVAEAVKASPSLIIQGLLDYSWSPPHGAPSLKLPTMVAQLVCHLTVGFNVRGAGLLLLAAGHALRSRREAQDVMSFMSTLS